MPSLDRQLKTIQNQIDSLQSQVKSLEAERDELKRRTSFLCNCGKRHQIGNLTFIQTHYYVHPSGCSDGDYWLPDNDGFFICPVNGVRYRLYHDKDLIKLRGFWKNVVHEHNERNKPWQFLNLNRKSHA